MWELHDSRSICKNQLHFLYNSSKHIQMKFPKYNTLVLKNIKYLKKILTNMIKTFILTIAEDY